MTKKIFYLLLGYDQKYIKIEGLALFDTLTSAPNFCLPILLLFEAWNF